MISVDEIQKEAHSLAPALDRGLTIIEMLLASPRPLGFREIAKELNLSSASTVRLLKVLCSRRYVLKDSLSGKYQPGPKILSFGQRTPLIDRLRDEAAPLMREIMERCGNTVLLVHLVDLHTLCLAKVMHPAAAPMQEVGEIGRDIGECPWGWILYDTLDPETRRVSLAAMDEPDIFLQHVDAYLAYYRQHGFTYDDQGKIPTVRRLAAPVFDENGKCIGALCLGGNLLTITEDQVLSLGRILVGSANLLSILMGYNQGS